MLIDPQRRRLARPKTELRQAMSLLAGVFCGGALMITGLILLGILPAP